MNDTRIAAKLTRVMRPVAAKSHRPSEHKRLRQEVLHSLHEAEEFLDWLDATGHTQRRLLIVGQSVIVKWR